MRGGQKPGAPKGVLEVSDRIVQESRLSIGRFPYIGFSKRGVRCRTCLPGALLPAALKASSCHGSSAVPHPSTDDQKHPQPQADRKGVYGVERPERWASRSGIAADTHGIVQGDGDLIEIRRPGRCTGHPRTARDLGRLAQPGNAVRSVSLAEGRGLDALMPLLDEEIAHRDARHVYGPPGSTRNAPTGAAG